MSENNGEEFELFLHLDPKETPMEEIEHTPESFIDSEVSKEEGLELLLALQEFDERYGVNNAHLLGEGWVMIKLKMWLSSDERFANRSLELANDYFKHLLGED